MEESPVEIQTAGLLSTIGPLSSQHPEVALDMLRELREQGYELAPISEFARARYIMAKTLGREAGLRGTYVANISCRLQDELGVDRDVANSCAARLLELIFEA